MGLGQLRTRATKCLQEDCVMVMKYLGTVFVRCWPVWMSLSTSHREQGISIPTLFEFKFEFVFSLDMQSPILFANAGGDAL